MSVYIVRDDNDEIEYVGAFEKGTTKWLSAHMEAGDCKAGSSHHHVEKWGLGGLGILSTACVYDPAEKEAREAEADVTEDEAIVMGLSASSNVIGIVKAMLTGDKQSLEFFRASVSPGEFQSGALSAIAHLASLAVDSEDVSPESLCRVLTSVQDAMIRHVEDHDHPEDEGPA